MNKIKITVEHATEGSSYGTPAYRDVASAEIALGPDVDENTVAASAAAVLKEASTVFALATIDTHRARVKRETIQSVVDEVRKEAEKRGQDVDIRVIGDPNAGKGDEVADAADGIGPDVPDALRA